MNPERLIAIELFAIDPGAGGGIAKYNEGRVETWKMPNSFDDLCDFFDYQKSICKNPLICIEKVQLWQGDDKHKGKEDGRQFRIQKMLNHYAGLIAAIRTRGYQYIEVAPITWMSYLILRIKNEDRVIRKRRFKDIASERYPMIKVNLNNADALLILEFIRTKVKYDPLWVVQNIQRKSDNILTFKQ